MAWRSTLLLTLVFGGGTALACRESLSPRGTERLSAEAQGDQEEPVMTGPCVPTGPELCFNALDDNCNGLLDEGCGVQSRLVHFMAAWAEADVDVDLHVADPGGEIAEVGHVSESGLTKQHDCPGKQNLCYGQNYENVYLEGDDPPAGMYQITVRLDDLGSAEPPIVVRVGARIGGSSRNAIIRLMHQEDEQTLSFHLHGVSEEPESGVASGQSGTGTR